MSAAIETVVRAKLAQWATAVFGSTLADPLTVRTEPPEPGEVTDLPNVSFWFDTPSNELEQVPRVAASAVVEGTLWGAAQWGDPWGSETEIAGWIVGDKTAELQVLWRLASKADALAIRAAWSNELATTAFAYNGIVSGVPTNIARNQMMVHAWALDWTDILAPSTLDEVEIPIQLSVSWTGEDQLAGPEDTGARDLYELRYGAQIDYPWAVRAPIIRWHAFLADPENGFLFDLDDWSP